MSQRTNSLLWLCSSWEPVLFEYLSFLIDLRLQSTCWKCTIRHILLNQEFIFPDMQVQCNPNPVLQLFLLATLCQKKRIYIFLFAAVDFSKNLIVLLFEDELKDWCWIIGQRICTLLITYIPLQLTLNISMTHYSSVIEEISLDKRLMMLIIHRC